MKTIVAVVFTFFALSSFAQLMDGSLLDEGRKMISKSDFTIYDSNEGVLYYTLAVDRKGKVTSATLVGEGSTITFTPTRMKVRNYLMLLQFEEGTHYPQFHHVRVKVTVKEPVID
jgi:hypothetical protein